MKNTIYLLLFLVQDQKRIWNALQNQEVDEKNIKILKNIFIGGTRRNYQHWKKCTRWTSS